MTSSWSRHEANPLIVADGLDIDAARSGSTGGGAVHSIIKELQILPSIFEINKDIDLPEEVIGGNLIVEAKIAHHRSTLLEHLEQIESRRQNTVNRRLFHQNRPLTVSRCSLWYGAGTH